MVPFGFLWGCEEQASEKIWKESGTGKRANIEANWNGKQEEN